jgi:hypothetical protein
MSERGPSLTSFEVKFTVGNAEKSMEKKIQETAKRITESGILKKENFKDEVERNSVANRMIGSLGMGFSSYESLIDTTCDSTRPLAQKNGESAFDMLRRSVSLAMNTGGDQELQTRLFTGGVSEVLPESWKYNNNGASGLDLEQGVVEVTITDRGILEKVRKLDKTKRRVDLNQRNERSHFAGKVEEVVCELLDMDVVDEAENQLMAVKSYLSTEAGILRGSFKESDGSADKTDVAAVLGEAAEKISRAAERMSYTTGRQGEIVDRQNKAVGEFAFNMRELYDNKLGDRVLSEIEDDEMRKGLSRNTDNSELRDGLAVNKVAKQIEKTGPREVRFPADGIDGIYKMIEFIEDGVSDVDNLTKNADKYKILYFTQKGEFNKQLEGMSYRGKVLNKDDVKEFCDEIGARMFLHSFYLAASKCKSIEDILRTVSSMHEGEMENDWDRFLVGSFLENRGGRKGLGLRELPVSKAWNLRQDGYFKIDEVFKSIKSNSAFVEYLKKENSALLGKVAEKGGFGKVLKLEVEIARTKDYGVPKDIYRNFFQMQKAGGLDMEVTKEYMIWQLMENGKYTREEATRAYTLAQKLSVATFSDSKVNLNFAADDYAELILFKYVRISNGPGGKPDDVKEGKSKPIGAGETIKFIDTLTCHWMDLSIRDDKKKWRTVSSPLYAEDIDFNKMSGKGNMPYHFFGVVNSQVLGVQEGFYEKLNAKDVNSLNYLPKIFAKINKTAYDMCRAGIMPVYYPNERERRDVYESGSGKQVEARIAEKMRKAWLTNLMWMAGELTTDWTMVDVNHLKKNLINNRQLFDRSGKQGNSFVPERDVDHVFTLTGVRMKVQKKTSSRKWTEHFWK